ncbi:MAG: PHP domain-containing protein [Nanoarchaeota archaeon]
MIDLQSHTVASDGELSPEELVDLAVAKGIKAIAITDHDTLASIKKAVDYSKAKGIEIVPGIELSCDDPLFGLDKIDVLGLLVDYKNKYLIKLTEHINKKRDENKREVIKKLNSLGFEIDFDEVKKTAKGTFGRPHIAKFLLKKYPDKFKSVADVFDQLIGTGKPAFVGTEGRVSIKEGIQTIKNAGGVAILAHPGVYPKDRSLKIIDFFIGEGGDGIETYYPYHVICPHLHLDAKGNIGLIDFYRNIVKSKKILESGGNDYHGNYRSKLGEVNVPDIVLYNLKKKKSPE